MDVIMDCSGMDGKPFVASHIQVSNVWPTFRSKAYKES